MSKGLKLFLMGSVFLGVFCLSNEVSARIPYNQYRQDNYSGDRGGWQGGDQYFQGGWNDGAPVGGDFRYQGGYGGGYPGSQGNYPPGAEVGGGFNGPGFDGGAGAGFNGPGFDGGAGAGSNAPYQGDGGAGFQYGQGQPLSPNTYPQ